jgi:hypothetical protein
MPELLLNNVNVSRINPEALLQLRTFLDDKRNPHRELFESTTFCDTIYSAIL